jgi:quercetin dioxygenase-like cupin family protein
MPDQMILETLTNSNKKLDSVTKRLDTLKALFENTPIYIINPREDGFVLANTIEAHTILQSGDVSVTQGIWAKAGDIWPEHLHKSSVEYLIVARGRFLIKLGDVPRTMGMGECASVPMGLKHSVIAIEDNSQMIGICVPPEYAYCVEDLTCQIFPGKS